MAHENLTYEDLLRIVELVKSSERFSEFRLKVGEIEVELKRRNGAGSAVQPLPAEAPSAPGTGQQAADAQAPERPAPPAREQPAFSWPPDAVVVRSPMVGTFYRAPAPGAPPFVTIGQRVEAETTVCIIEVMKLMNSIPAGASGVVTRILVEDGQPVDAHAPLIVLDPTP